MQSKYKVIVVLLLVVIAALVTAMLSSALLGQQHNWYDTYKPGNDVPCTKCHGNIEAEFLDMPTGAPHKTKTCEFCHRNETNVTYAVGDIPTTPPIPIPGKEAHAASIPPCRQCHTLHTIDIYSVNESHKPLVDTSDLNEACILCHTGFDKSMEFTRALYLKYNITEVSGKWTVENGFEFVSTNSTVINQTPPGGKHTWEDASVLDCFDCHSDVKSALKNDGHVPQSKNTGGEHGGKKAQEGHKGRRHNFSRTSVTIESCKPCHLPDAADFGSSHPEAQLDYHAATTEHCYNCHYYGTENAPGSGGGGGGGCAPCHNILRTAGDHTEIVDSMETQNFCGYQMDKVCVGCHMPGPDDNVQFYNRQFKVYTEPSATIWMTPTPPP